MRTRTWVPVVLVMVLAAGAAGCGDDETGATVPTAEQLAATLATPETYEGDWSVNAGPDGTEQAASGVLTAEQQELVPTMELCDEASPESRAAADTLRWTVFRQLDLAVEDPIDVPRDREGHLVFLQEAMTSGDPAEMASTFALLREGMQACLGDHPAEDEGGVATLTELAVPEVGDARYGVLLTMEEAEGWAEWRIHENLVQDGPVLMLLNVVDIRAGEGVEPYYSTDDVGGMLTTAVDQL
jgi:hypothetical protein